MAMINGTVVLFNHVRTEAFITRDGEPGAKLVVRALNVELLSDGNNASDSDGEDTDCDDMPF